MVGLNSRAGDKQWVAELALIQPRNVQNMSLREALGWADLRLLSSQGWLQQKVNFFMVIMHLCTT